MKLYELPPAFARFEAIMNEEGEFPPELFDEMQALDMALEHKIDACCRVVRQLEAEHELYKRESERLAAKAATSKTNVQKLKAYMLANLQTMKLRRCDTPLFKVWQHPSPKSVKVEADPKSLPPEFQKTTIEVNKAALMEAFESGQPLPQGVTVESGTHLRIS